MEFNGTQTQLFQEIQNHLHNILESRELSRAEAQLRLANRKMQMLEDRLLSDPFHSDADIASTVAFKRGMIWGEAYHHIADLARVAA